MPVASGAYKTSLQCRCLQVVVTGMPSAWPPDTSVAGLRVGVTGLFCTWKMGCLGPMLPVGGFVVAVEHRSHGQTAGAALCLADNWAKLCMRYKLCMRCNGYSAEANLTKPTALSVLPVWVCFGFVRVGQVVASILLVFNVFG